MCVWEEEARETTDSVATSKSEKKSCIATPTKGRAIGRIKQKERKKKEQTRTQGLVVGNKHIFPDFFILSPSMSPKEGQLSFSSFSRIIVTVIK